MEIKITMNLYDTDKKELVKFLKNDVVQPDLILYNFAKDLIYADYIQSDLLLATIPSFLKSIKCLKFDNSLELLEIVSEFSAALFINKKNIIKAIGNKEFKKIIFAYQEVLIEQISSDTSNDKSWISLFNTLLAIDFNSLGDILLRIPLLNKEGVFSFFSYLSCFIYFKKDNLFDRINLELFETSVIWGFNSDLLFWRKETIDCFNALITVNFVKTLFEKARKNLLLIEKDAVLILEDDFNNGQIFKNLEHRKKEYLDKISNNESYKYWNDGFV